MRTKWLVSVELSWIKYSTDDLLTGEHSKKAKMKTIIITQTGSQIKCPKRQKDNLKALGLGRIGKSLIVEATPQVLGMVEKVHHLVSVKEAV